MCTDIPTTTTIHGSTAPAGACGRRLAAVGIFVLTAIVVAAAARAAADPPRSLQLTAQTGTGVTVWSERCSEVAHPADAIDASRPQPDPLVLGALAAALRDGDLRSRGVQVVETADGPLLKVAGQRPGAPDTYFELCDVAIRTAYD
jgi:hypothetical protein